MPDDLDLRIKEYIRKHLGGMMAEQVKLSRIYGWVPGIVIKESEMERWIDDLWTAIVQQDYENKKKDTTIEG